MNGCVPKKWSETKLMVNIAAPSLKPYAISFDEVQDKILGKIGTPDRDRFEHELTLDLIGKAIPNSFPAKMFKYLNRHAPAFFEGKVIGGLKFSALKF